MPSRACLIAREATLCTSSTYCPSTFIVFIPNASARLLRSRIGECWDSGVDSAQWLSSSTKTAGTCQSCARLSDSWNVPMLVAPSPKKAIATRGSLRSLNESAAPVIAGSPPPTTAFAPRFPRSTS